MAKRIKSESTMGFYGGTPHGDPTLQGTRNFGKGGIRQLAGTLDPAVEDIHFQETEEANENDNDQAWMLGTSTEKARMPVFGSRPGLHNEASSNPADTFSRRTPAFRRPNTLVKQVVYVPDETTDGKRQAAKAYYDSQAELYANQLAETEPKPMVDESVTSSYLLSSHKDFLSDVPEQERKATGSPVDYLAAPKNYVPEDPEEEDDGYYDLGSDSLYSSKVERANTMKESLQKLVDRMVCEHFVQTLSETTAKDIRRLLRKHKCVELRQTGSHLQVRCDGGCVTTIPVHGNHDIKTGTLKAIEKSLGMCLGPDWTSVKPRKGRRENDWQP